MVCDRQDFKLMHRRRPPSSSVLGLMMPLDLTVVYSTGDRSAFCSSASLPGQHQQPQSSLATDCHSSSSSSSSSLQQQQPQSSLTTDCHSSSSSSSSSLQQQQPQSSLTTDCHGSSSPSSSLQQQQAQNCHGSSSSSSSSPPSSRSLQSQNPRQRQPPQTQQRCPADSTVRRVPLPPGLHSFSAADAAACPPRTSAAAAAAAAAAARYEYTLDYYHRDWTEPRRPLTATSATAPSSSAKHLDASSYSRSQQRHALSKSGHFFVTRRQRRSTSGKSLLSSNNAFRHAVVYHSRRPQTPPPVLPPGKLL